MKSLRRTLLYRVRWLYGAAIWFLWVSLVVIAFEVLPTPLTNSAFFVSMKMVTLVMLVLTFTTLSLRKGEEKSLFEGLLIGLVWTATIIVLDLVHYFMVPFEIAQYFLTVVPTYVVIPFMTTMIMGLFKQKSWTSSAFGERKEGENEQASQEAASSSPS